MISEKRELVFEIAGGPLCNCKVNELNAVNTGSKGSCEPPLLPHCPPANVSLSRLRSECFSSCREQVAKKWSAFQALPSTRSSSHLISSQCKSSGPFEINAVMRLYCSLQYTSLFLMLLRSHSEGAWDNSEMTLSTIPCTWCSFCASLSCIPVRINVNKAVLM